MTEMPFDAAVAARRVLREATDGALASLDETGAPYASLVSVATEPDGSPILLVSRLALHTGNIERDPRTSLLLRAAVSAAEDPLALARLSLSGRMERIEDDGAARRRFLARHPEAALYAGFADFAFWRLATERAHLVAGFGRIVDLAPADLLLDLGGHGALVEAEAGAVAHMNEDHADAVRLYATRLLDRRDGAWRMVGLDPEGCDLMLGAEAARLTYPRPVADPGRLRSTLADLAKIARSG